MMGDPIKTLVSRYASLPYILRMEIAKRLLLRDADQSAHGETKSFIEEFWDEVESSHNDGLYPRNPFSDKKLKLSY